VRAVADGVGGGDQPAFGFAGMETAELHRLWRERSVSTESVQAARADYVRLTALRTELFSRLEAPASVKKWGGDRK
jgi:hypothetical protein